LFADSSNTVNSSNKNTTAPASATKARPNGRTRSPAQKRQFRDGQGAARGGGGSSGLLASVRVED
jgi:hypothetical protein